MLIYRILRNNLTTYLPDVISIRIALKHESILDPLAYIRGLKDSLNKAYLLLDVRNGQAGML